MSLDSRAVSIVPSVLVEDGDTFAAELASVRDTVDMVQIDLADGEFVPNVTWAYEHPEEAIELLDDMPFELHLMVVNPIETAETWKDAPGLRRYLLHVESTDDVARAIEELHRFDKHVGLVLNPSTPVETALPFLDRIESVMFMGVNPGFQGQAFIPETLDRIAMFKQYGTDHPVAVDGAVNLQTIRSIADAGATVVCPGSAVFGGPESPAENIWRLEEVLQGFAPPDEELV